MHELPKQRPDGAPYPVQLDDAELHRSLEPLAFHVLRQAGTEPPYSGEYENTETEGVYHCRACDAELFRSDAKFHSGCGGPSFYAPTENDAVVLLVDHLLGYPRTEVRCQSCGSHLGHVFHGEGYPTPTDQRWCINSVCLRLEPTSAG